MTFYELAIGLVIIVVLAALIIASAIGWCVYDSKKQGQQALHPSIGARYDVVMMVSMLMACITILSGFVTLLVIHIANPL